MYKKWIQKLDSLFFSAQVSASSPECVSSKKKNLPEGRTTVFPVCFCLEGAPFQNRRSLPHAARLLETQDKSKIK
ncbi:hypothetical protein [uncultured Desulfovibrio sp.]|uniref:hypothetical protein n=1 Tax=uncultured Desulfovibrio sp. TaxID=167968 RepID=UPI00261365C4|nr:hypothetical protein [uncultured Desulfovibrio sp.]